MCTFRISLLGTTVTIRSDAEEDYLQRLCDHLTAKVEETQSLVHVADPLKSAILAGFFLSDELLREREKKSGPDPGEAEEMERITLELIYEIDKALNEN